MKDLELQSRLEHLVKIAGYHNGDLTSVDVQRALQSVKDYVISPWAVAHITLPEWEEFTNAMLGWFRGPNFYPAAIVGAREFLLKLLRKERG